MAETQPKHTPEKEQSKFSKFYEKHRIELWVGTLGVMAAALLFL